MCLMHVHVYFNGHLVGIVQQRNKERGQLLFVYYMKKWNKEEEEEKQAYKRSLVMFSFTTYVCNLFKEQINYRLDIWPSIFRNKIRPKKKSVFFSA